MTTHTQSTRGHLGYPTSRLLHRLSRTPLLLWRLGLDALLGRVFMVIATWGRKSGLPRYAMIDQIEIDGALYAWSGHGPHADWYRNLAANPLVTIQTATQAMPARARRVTDAAELTRLLDRFRRTHPLRARSYFGAYGVSDEPGAIAASHASIYLIALEATDESTPPPLRHDLRWLWLLALPLGVAWWISRSRP
jgi:deazaflavin-dependent oxidoreductase (nitroreductase family)